MLHSNKTARLGRNIVAWTVTTAMTFSMAGVILATTSDAANATYAATGELNIRSGPSTSTKILYTLKKNDVVIATGKAAGGWLPIKFNDGKAYVTAKYAKAKKTTAPAITSVKGKKTTTVNVNLRDGASLKSGIVKVVKKGTEVAVTGRSSGEFSEVSVDNKTRWLYTAYLGKAVNVTPEVIGNATTTAELALRADALTSSTALATVPENAAISVVGVHKAQYSQVVFNKQTGWILTGYFKSTTGGLNYPVAKSKKYVNAVDVNMRAAADVESQKITTVSSPTQLAATGTEKNKYTQIIYAGMLRWVSSQYLSDKEPSPSANLGTASLNKLERYGKAAVIEIREAFPQIKTIGGWRSSSSYSSDHPNGRAIDIMIPDYKKNKALGDKMATWVINNGKRLHVNDLIWYQRNWRITRGAWVKMANRGSDNQNHKNHVHVSFNKS
ncbi:MAG: SH3 domain-containing protein [Propionibacteriaceae bacterium]|jgi:uncharacterized protein YgiM (DUF1202 family)|nr:SH3 domain-containing protein [Propionibacteriaceae bacterium]